MSKELVGYTDEQIKEIDGLTGYKPPTPTPVIKFNAKDDADGGKWFKTTGKIDEGTGKPEYEEIKGDSVILHVIAYHRKRINSGMKWKGENISSGEVGLYDSVVTLYGENKDEMGRGTLAQLRQEHPDWDLNFSRILYVFYEDKPYKLYLAGGKSVIFGDYEKKMGRLVLHETKMSADELVDNDYGGKNWTMKIEKGKALDFNLIKERINDVNEYLKSVGNDSLVAEPSEVKKVEQIQEPTVEPINEPNGEPSVQIQDVPFG